MNTEILKFGSFQFDASRRELSRDGNVIRLGSRALDILAALIAARGNIVSKQELMERVWHGQVVEENNLQVQVSALRKALQEGKAGQNHLVTVPGRGYRLVGIVGADPSAPGEQIDRPLIAVLPFQNLSGVAEHEFFADGLVEEIITALSRNKWFLVIARNSSFAYKGRAVDVKQVARELGVQYVLEGSVRRSDRRLRISTQLVEAESAAHVWADKYDGTVDDIFDFQDHITACVVNAMEPHLRDAEIKRRHRKRPTNLSAYDYYLRGMAQFAAETAEGTAEALRLLSQANANDPNFAPPYAVASWCVVYRIFQNWTDDPARDVREAARLAGAAIERDRDDPAVLALAAHALSFATLDHRTALALIERSLTINPNSAVGLHAAGWVRTYVGDAAPAIECFARALRISPLDSRIHLFFSGLAFGHIMLGQSGEAIKWARKCVENNPRWIFGFKALAAALANEGRLDEARQAAARVLASDPDYSLRHTVRLITPGPWRDHYLSGMRKAGIPD